MNCENTECGKYGLNDETARDSHDSYWKSSHMVRKSGNGIAWRIADMVARHRDVPDMIIGGTCSYWNERDSIQETLHIAAGKIDLLIKWRDDQNPRTWKWVPPFEIGKKESMVMGDDHNRGWVSDAAKRQVVIQLIHPETFLQLADSRMEKFTKKAADDYRFNMRNIAVLQAKFEKKSEMDAPYIIMEKNENRYKVISHEGRHRAWAALFAGITLMPVYLYTYNAMSFDDRLILGDDISRVRSDDSF